MSKVLPAAIQDRPDLNLRQGIKSSLSNWRQLLASLYLFHRYGGSSFCKEIPTGAKTQLDVDDQFAMWLNANLNSVFNVVPLVKQSTLYSAQMEHLQVGLELFLKLAKVDFVDSTLADSAERTGGSRFAKRIRFSTNMKLLVDTINSYSDSDRTNFLSQWLSGADDAIVSKRVKEVLAPFTEECQYKIRTASGEISFQEDGVYAGLRNVGDTVESSDMHEPVGPFRILKSYVKEEMHPYLSDSSSGFVLKAQQAEFTDYADMVRTTLELIPKRTVVFQEVTPIVTQQTSAFCEEPKQLITYGAPGTGKSHRTKLETEGRTVYRTTFHPDSDYSTFVGAYKPTMVGDEIAYSFVPQAFVNAYVAAWKRMKDAGDGAVAGGAPKTPTGVDLVMVNAIKSIIAENGDGYVATREEIVAKAEALDTYKKNSLLPSDYCYNRVNAGISLSKPTLLEYLGNAKYKCLGLDADYNGPVYRRASGADEDVKVGVCEHGVRKLDGDSGEVDSVYLVIEEINRGNCAQIFGDLFQLLDRNDAGYSDYPIAADADLARYIHGELKDVGLGSEFEDIVGIDDGHGKIKMKLMLPPNLYIRATMNTSDQSLFPIDSAFKRRWDWEYTPIKDESKGWYVKVGTDKYKWWSFLEKINAVVCEATLSADKQMGYFFVKLANGQTEIDLKKFVNKVAFYLWNDVFKDCDIREDALKLKDDKGNVGEPIKFTDFFEKNSNVIDEKVVKDLFEGLGVKKVAAEVDAGEGAEAEEGT